MNPPYGFDRFRLGLAFTLKEEGGYVNNKADSGHATNKGITQAEYDAWRRGQNLPARGVAFITDDEVTSIYLTDYWLKAGCQALPAPVDLAVFDAAVNSGVSRSVRWLQQELGVKPDGIPGEGTEAALAARTPLDVALQIINTREDYYHEIVSMKPSQAVFLHGWLTRIDNLKKAITNPSPAGEGQG